MTTEQLTREVLGKPVADRVALARTLIASLHGAPSEDEESILKEARRRDAELDAGGAMEIDHEEVMASARARLRCG